MRFVIVILLTCYFSLLTMSAVKADAALEAFKNEKKVLAALKDDLWIVNVEDDGTPRFGFGSYLCNVLAESENIQANTMILVMDEKGEKNLGLVRCSDFKFIE